MAQGGDTITYTFSGSRVSEDVSNVGEAEILYCEAGGDGEGNNAGGRVENVVVDVSDESMLYIWVAEQGSAGGGFGRYDGGDSGSTREPSGGGSSEVSLLATDADDSATEPFIVGAGGGAGKTYFDDGDGARGSFAEGQAPPEGGRVGGDKSGEGAVAGHGSTATITDNGTTITGGGETGNGEIKISYKQSLSPPDPPSNLSATVQ